MKDNKSGWQFPKALEIIKCKEGNKEFMKERPARRPFGNTVLICEYPIDDTAAEEPNAKLITWRLAKRAARDFLRVSFMPSAIVSAATHSGKTAVRVYGKYYVSQFTEAGEEMVRGIWQGFQNMSGWLESRVRSMMRDIVAAVEEEMDINSPSKVFPLKHGVDFLGFHTYLTESGAVIRKVRRRSKNNMKRKLKKLAALHAAGRIDAKTVEQSYQSWRGHAEKGNSYHLIRRTDQYYNSLMKTKEAAQCQKH